MADASFLPAASDDPAAHETEDYLEDELQLQEVILDSIRGTEGDTPTARAQHEAEINSIRKKLKKLRSGRTGSSSNMNGTNSFRAYPGGISPARMAQNGPDVWGFSGDDQSRKRTYSNHLGAGQPSFSEPKSRRTTPSPREINLDNPFDDDDNSSVIDLTGADDREAARERQKEKEERFRQNKRQEEADAELARKIQSGDLDFDDLTPSSAAGRSSQSGPNAFDRMINRPSQSSQQAQSSGQTRNGASPGGPTQSTYSTYSNGSQPYTDGRSLSNASMTGIPSHIKSPLHDLFGQGSTRPGPFDSVSRGSRMPGTYDSGDEDDLFNEFMMQPGHLSRSTSLQPNSAFSPASTLFSHPQSTAFAPPGELARLAAMRRQGQLHGLASPGPGFHNYASGSGLSSFNQPQSYTPNGIAGPGPSSVAYSSGTQPWNSAPSGSRPGSVANGSANLLRGPNDNPYAASGSGSSLRDVIDLTNGFDWQNGTDTFGNLLPPQFRDYMGDYMDPTKTQEQIRDLFANLSGNIEVPEDDQEGSPDGLKCSLYRHQQIALKWMKEMENDAVKKGGILADDMGLGKTISTIALMLSHRVKWEPFSVDRPKKTNVIVAPVALLMQWDREIKRKVTYRNELSVYNYHQKKVDYETIRKHDVVLTTYGTLASELKKFDKYVEKCDREKRQVDQEWLQRECPFLSPKSEFHRVILDEAQQIKNRNTKSAAAARKIQANYRWVLTGTPMMNNISELSSLIEFLRIKPYDVPKTFSKTFGCLSASRSGGQDKQQAMRKLQVLLKAVMLRRTKTSTIDGKPIVELPRKVEVIDHVVFDDDELGFYKQLEEESKVEVSKYLKAGTVGKHYAVVLVRLLKLRQACCHPFLHLTDLEVGNGETPDAVMIDLAKALGLDVINRLKNDVVEQEGAIDCPICMDTTLNPTLALCGHGMCGECWVKFTANAARRNIQDGTENGNLTCPECRKPVEAKNIITYEIFKKVHMPELIANGDDETAPDDDETASEDEEDDVDYVDERGNLKSFIVDDGNDGLDEQNTADYGDSQDYLGILESKPNKGRLGEAKALGHKANGKKPRKSKKSKGKKKERERDPLPHELAKLRKDAGRNAKAHKKYMSYLKSIWENSAKVKKCKELIADIQKTGEKTIVFSQWTMLLDLLEIPINNELKLGYRRYDGGMSATMRDNAVNDFVEKSNVKVILVSLKAGNAGLNLTAASQVIIMDPFWNPFIENQAVDRAHRIGQRNPVKVHRLLVNDTVEDRIIAIQQRKRELVEGALDEGVMKSLHLDAGDIAHLFGIS